MVTFLIFILLARIRKNRTKIKKVKNDGKNERKFRRIWDKMSKNEIEALGKNS